MFTIVSFFIAILIFASISIRLKTAFLIFIFGLIVLLFTFSYQASLVPDAKKVKQELENNPLIIRRNNAIAKAKQINSTTTFHPLAHFSAEEQQNRIKQVLGAWQDEPEIDTIFAEIDRDRHSYRGRQIDSFDD